MKFVEKLKIRPSGIRLSGVRPPSTINKTYKNNIHSSKNNRSIEPPEWKQYSGEKTKRKEMKAIHVEMEDEEEEVKEEKEEEEVKEEEEEEEQEQEEEKKEQEEVLRDDLEEGGLSDARGSKMTKMTMTKMRTATSDDNKNIRVKPADLEVATLPAPASALASLPAWERKGRSGEGTQGKRGEERRVRKERKRNERKEGNDRKD